MQLGNLSLICGHVRVDVVLPVQRYILKKKTLVAGLETDGSDSFAYSAQKKCL
jgi:hypothetical protein